MVKPLLPLLDDDSEKMTKYDPQIHKRRSIRLPHHNYAGTSSYFITICSHQRQCLFGEVEGERTRLNHLGYVAQKCWKNIPEHFPHVTIDEFVLMPNHLHGILHFCSDTEAKEKRIQPAFAQGRQAKTLGSVIASYKAAVAKQIRQTCNSPHLKVWQRNYYEKIVRDQTSLYAFRTYIQQNPLQWYLDADNPQNISQWSNLELDISF